MQSPPSSGVNPPPPRKNTKQKNNKGASKQQAEQSEVGETKRHRLRRHPKGAARCVCICIFYLISHIVLAAFLYFSMISAERIHKGIMGPRKVGSKSHQ